MLRGYAGLEQATAKLHHLSKRLRALAELKAATAELTHVIALENLRGRFNLAMGIGAAGFSEGMVCALPVTLSADE